MKLQTAPLPSTSASLPQGAAAQAHGVLEVEDSKNPATWLRGRRKYAAHDAAAACLARCRTNAACGQREACASLWRAASTPADPKRR